VHDAQALILIPMPKTFINPSDLFLSVDRWGFSQDVSCADAGRLVFLSGQTAWGANESVVGTTRWEQFAECVTNIRRALQAAGGSFSDVVSLRLYMVNYDPSETDDVALALREAFPGEHPPATT